MKRMGRINTRKGTATTAKGLATLVTTAFESQKMMKTAFLRVEMLKQVQDDYRRVAPVMRGEILAGLVTSTFKNSLGCHSELCEETLFNGVFGGDYLILAKGSSCVGMTGWGEG